MAIGKVTMQQLHILHYTFRVYNCTNCDQLHVKICPVEVMSCPHYVVYPAYSGFLFVFLSVKPSICLSVCLSVRPSVHLSIYQSIRLSVYLSICLSIYLLDMPLLPYTCTTGENMCL